MLWADPVSFIWHGDHRRNDDICDSKPKIARLSKPTCYVRNIISGVELDVVLVGSLKVCVGKLSHGLRSAVVDYTAPCMRIIEGTLDQLSARRKIQGGERRLVTDLHHRSTYLFTYFLFCTGV